MDPGFRVKGFWLFQILSDVSRILLYGANKSISSLFFPMNGSMTNVNDFAGVCQSVVHYNMVSPHNPRGSIFFSQFLAITMLQLYLVARSLNESEAGVDLLSVFLMLIMLFSF